MPRVPCLLGMTLRDPETNPCPGRAIIGQVAATLVKQDREAAMTKGRVVCVALVAVLGAAAPSVASGATRYAEPAGTLPNMGFYGLPWDNMGVNRDTAPRTPRLSAGATQAFSEAINRG